MSNMCCEKKTWVENNWKVIYTSDGQNAEKELECAVPRVATKERNDVALRQIKRIASVSEQVSKTNLF